MAITVLGLIGLWQFVVMVSEAPPYLLPGPLAVLKAWIAWRDIILGHAGVTLAEIVIGLIVGTTVGIASAIIIAQVRPARRWLLPVLVISQAIPVFAIAPLLVLWLGYGMASKIAMAALIIYFPVTASFLDGLRRTDPGWLDLAQTMTAGVSVRRWRGAWAALRHVRMPAALPALASGVRVAAAVAPIGAVVGEWVGSSAGLGYLMLHANARVQIDVMFAALITLAAIAVALYFTVDWTMRCLLPWQSDTLPGDELKGVARQHG
jgi:putative hydroxymethylpyrimidine transport system permease protein